MLNALSIDVEDYFHVHAFASVIDRSQWDSYPSRVVENTRRVLRLLEEHGTRATFFVLGWVAERQPELIRQIWAGGHEIASHGYWHQLVYRQTPEEFVEDLRRSVSAIREACPAVCLRGYRAPSFSITKRSAWALNLLPDLGFCYDSSVSPVSIHDVYGMADAPRFAHRIHPRLFEFPPSTVRCVKRNWPIAGGGYFRLFPFWLTCRAIRGINAENHPAVVYLHPWELDPDQPRIRHAPLLSRFRHYNNLQKTERRLQMLLKRFRFAPLCEAFSSSLNDLAYCTYSPPQLKSGEGGKCPSLPP